MGMAADRVAFLFPGQGSQSPGMGSDLMHKYTSIVRRYFETADEVLGFHLSRLCFDGSADELLDTSVTQPGVFVTSLAAAAVLQDRGIRPGVVAGHSLGEYTALVCAGVLEWTDALRLVRMRGLMMAEVNRRTPGRMVAVVGLDAPRVHELCEQASALDGETAEVANYNAPQQTVVSGTVAGVDVVAGLAREAGAESVKVLPVGAPFHCSLMADVVAELREHFDAVRFATPAVPVVANVTAEYVHSGDEARQLLLSQLASPVRWDRTLQLLNREEVSALVEIGPGRVLTNINRNAVPEILAMAAGTARQIGKAVSQLTGDG